MPINSPNVIKYINLQTQEAWKTSSGINSDRNQQPSDTQTISTQQNSRENPINNINKEDKNSGVNKMCRTPEKYKSRLEQTERQPLFFNNTTMKKVLVFCTLQMKCNCHKHTNKLFDGARQVDT